MALLSDHDRQALTERLSALSHQVTLVFVTQSIGAPDSVLVAKQIVDEIVSLDNRIQLEELNLILDKDRAAAYGIDRIPAVVVLRDGEDTRMRFLGAPEGYEFASLIEAVVLAGSNDSGLSPATRASVAERVSAPIDIKVFVTPTCPHCPRMVTLAYRLAVENANVIATGVEATEFLDLAQRYGVTGVPKTVVEGTDVEILGAVDENDFVNAILPPSR